MSTAAVITDALTPARCRELMQHLFRRRTEWFIRAIKPENEHADTYVAAEPSMSALWEKLDPANRKWLAGAGNCDALNEIASIAHMKLGYQGWVEVHWLGRPEMLLGAIDKFLEVKKDWFGYLVRLDDDALQRFLNLRKPVQRPQ